MSAKLLFLLLLSIYSSINLVAQRQKGSPLYGSTDDRFGASISMPDANNMAVGADYYSFNSTRIGQVKIYQWQKQGWIQRGSSITGEASYDYSGSAISMPDSNIVAIGAPYNNNQAGHVRIYYWYWNDSDWNQKGADIDGEASKDYSGYSVSMPNSDIIAIGAPFNDGSATDAGHVRIYRYDGSAWVQKGQDIDGEASGDHSGNAVSMPDANTVAIGAADNSSMGRKSAGHVRVYHWNGSAWVQKGSDIDGEAENDGSGFSLSMPDSNTVAIGALANDGNGDNSGHVRVYRWNGSAWVQKGSDIDGEAAKDQSGYSVSMPDSNMIAIGAPLSDGSAINTGNVRLFEWTGSSWVQKDNTFYGDSAGGGFGMSVTMPDRNNFGAGAPFSPNYYSEQNAGQVKTYWYCNSSSNISITACDSYWSPSGNYNWTNSGTYMDTISNENFCDSMMTINLTIKHVDISITESLPTLTANAIDASYQWVNCDSMKITGIGDTNKSFTPVINGNYAVIVTQDSCSDISECVAVNNVGIAENHISLFKVYPNPTAEKVKIEFNENPVNTHIEVQTIDGRVVDQYFNVRTKDFLIDLSNNQNGIYFLRIQNSNYTKVVKLIKY